MAGIRGLCRVMEVTKFAGRQGRAMVRIESTQVTSEIFAARLDLIVSDPQALAPFELGAEVIVDVVPTPRMKATAAAER